MDTLKNPCRLPLIAGLEGKKIYYRFDNHDRLQHWQFNNGSWSMPSDNLFQQSLAGFDGALDNQGLFHLLGYDHQGNIYQVNPSGTGVTPQLIYTAPRQIIHRLSCCFDQLNNLQILYLGSGKVKQRQQLFHLIVAQREKQQTSFVDFVDGGVNYCSIIADRLNRLYLIYPVSDEGSSRIAFRRMHITSRHPGRIYLLPGKQESAGPPSYYCDVQNYIHLAWISRYAGKAYLNYIRRDKIGDWLHFLQEEVSPQTLPAAYLSCTAKELIIYFQCGSRLSLLYSQDGGTSWHRGKDREVEQVSVLTRLRIDCNEWEKSEDSRRFFVNFSVPPVNMQQSTSYNSLEGIKATHNTGTLNSMAIISAFVFEQIHCLEVENNRLQQKMKEEIELATQLVHEQSKVAELEKMLEEKTLQSREAEQLYQDTLQKYHEKREREKEIMHEQLKLLRADVIKLQHKKEKLIRENSKLSSRIARYEEKEQSMLEFASIKRNSVTLNGSCKE
jgi:hypothetical protein